MDIIAHVVARFTGAADKSSDRDANVQTTGALPDATQCTILSNMQNFSFKC
ncbi:MAG TPA: hypothetical protein PKY22_12850 [Accumulibacter sp.]|nr:hypothetical protein [Accumulibacter sp.]